MAKKPTGRESPLDVEASIKRLETIVESLERGGVPLDQAMAMYEEGITLSKRCLEALQQAEVKLKRLSRDVNGTLTVRDEDSEE